MKSLSLKSGLLALSLSVLASPVLVQAQTPEASESAPADMGYSLPSELQDAPFNMYIDISLLEPAWRTRDAELLTDLALQLAQGERILLRSHKAGSSKDMLGLALKIAQANDNQAAVNRVAQAATVLKYDDLVALSKSSNKLAGASRRDEPALSVSVDKTDVNGFATFSWMVDQLRSVELLGNKDSLKGMGDTIDSARGLTTEQKEFLKRRIGEIQALPEDPALKDNRLAGTISKLEGESRGQDAGAVLNGVANIIGAATGNGYNNGGYNNGGYNNGGWNNGGYNNGGWNNGGWNNGGYNNGGWNKGGWNNGGYNNGGWNNGGWNNGGYNNGGWNKGGWNKGGWGG